MRFNSLSDITVIQILDNFKQTFITCEIALEEDIENGPVKLLYEEQMAAAKEFCNQITVAIQEGASWNESNPRFEAVVDRVNKYYAKSDT